METILLKPLTVNEAWQGRRFKTKKYKAFEDTMLWLLPQSVKVENKTPLKITLIYGFSSKLSDLDNPCKMVLDCLCKKYDFDDRYIFELIQKKEIVTKGNEFIKFKIEKLCTKRNEKSIS